MIELKNIGKTFQSKDGEVEALKDVSIKINDGDIFGIIGMSGAGKSTLVRCINMLEKPSEGTIEIDGEDVGSMSKPKLREMRRNVTMIFQGFNLLEQRTVLENVLFPLEITKVNKQVQDLQNALNPLKDLTFIPFSAERKIYTEKAWEEIEKYIKKEE